jgi:hypothetical protein
VQNVGGRAHVLSLNLLALLRRIPHPRGGAADRRAFVKSEPVSGTSVEVYLDTDTTGEEVTVTCTLYDDSGEGGTFAAITRPRLTDGCSLWVQQDKAGVWRNKTPIFRASAG